MIGKIDEILWESGLELPWENLDVWKEGLGEFHALFESALAVAKPMTDDFEADLLKIMADHLQIFEENDLVKKNFYAFSTPL